MTQYQRGILLERELVVLYKTVGCHSWRSAGSHGPYDVMVMGTQDAVTSGWAKMCIVAGFKSTDYGAHREKGKFIDDLYTIEFKSYNYIRDNKVALFIQCKRKEKKK